MSNRLSPIVLLLAAGLVAAPCAAAPPAADSSEYERLKREIEQLSADQARLVRLQQAAHDRAMEAIRSMNADRPAPATRDIVKVQPAPDLSVRDGFQPHHLARCSHFLDAQPTIDRELGAPPPLPEATRVQVRDFMRQAFTYLVAPEVPQAAWERIAAEERSAFAAGRAAGRAEHARVRNERVRLCSALINDHADEITRRLNRYAEELQRSR